MSLEKITALTKSYADERNTLIALADALQQEFDASIKKHAYDIRITSERLLTKQEILDDAIKANPNLFPAGKKSMVIAGIKVGYQMGKDRIDVPEEQEAETIELLKDLIKQSTRLQDMAGLERQSNALKVVECLADAGLKKLTHEELTHIKLAWTTAAESTLIKPAEEAAYTAVKAAIATAMKATKDAP